MGGTCAGLPGGGVVQCAGPLGGRVFRHGLPGAAQHGVEAHQPAGGDGGGAIAAAGAGEDDLGRGAGGHDEIMGHEADGFLRRGQPGGAAHGAAHPGAGIGGGGPDRFGQAAQHDQVGLLEPGFEQAPDEDARVFGALAAAQGAAAADDLAGEGGFQQAGQRVGALGREDGESGEEFVERSRERLAVFASPEAARTRDVGGGGQGLGGFEQGGQERVQRDGGVGGGGQERGEASGELVDEGWVGVFGDLAQAFDAGFGGGAAEGGAFQGPGGGAGSGRGEAGGGVGVFQEREQGHRAEGFGDGVGQQTEEGGGRGFQQVLAGAVIGDDTVAREFGGDAAGERAVGCDEGGAGVGGFQSVA